MALTDWAIYRLSDGYIDNVIWFDADTSRWTPPEGYGMVDIPDGLHGEWSACGIGWSYINNQFIEPPPPPEPVFNPDDGTVVQQNVAQQPIAQGVTNL